jgi:hypothetical protein
MNREFISSDLLYFTKVLLEVFIDLVDDLINISIKFIKTYSINLFTTLMAET